MVNIKFRPRATIDGQKRLGQYLWVQCPLSRV